ncbi:hypothetical protein B0H19DRAFT_561350 [Mycena capillaripes]|nr:hypothetical protein B0H19DRAFT_561350 [Mycena capillaripes]
MASFNDFNATLGAYELGVLVSYILLGVTTSHSYVYYSRFTSDTRRLKYLVAFIWACEMAHATCIGATLYQKTVSDFDHPERLVLIPRSLATAVLFSGIVGACVQSFFAARIYYVSSNLCIPCLSWSLSFLRLLGSITAFVYGLRTETMPEFEKRWAWLLNSLWSVASANDLIIAGTLVYWLHRASPSSRWTNCGSRGQTYSVDHRNRCRNERCWTSFLSLLRNYENKLYLDCFLCRKCKIIFKFFFGKPQFPYQSPSYRGAE